MLRSGGVAALSTEFRIEGPGLATRASCASTSPSCGACSWMGSVGPRRPDRHDDLTETLAAPVPMEEAVADNRSGKRGGAATPTSS